MSSASCTTRPLSASPGFRSAFAAGAPALNRRRRGGSLPPSPSSTRETVDVQDVLDRQLVRSSSVRGRPPLPFKHGLAPAAPEQAAPAAQQDIRRGLGVSSSGIGSGDGAHVASENRSLELALLRARFDLRLDVERAQTQEVSTEFRSALGEVVRSHQAGAFAELEAMRSSFEGAAALHRSAVSFEVSELRAEVEASRESRHADGVALHRQVARLEGELQASRSAEDREAAAAFHDRERVLSEVGDELGAAREHFSLQREAQVAEVVARFEHELFAQSAREAQEANRRCRAEEESSEIRGRLEALRAQLPEIAPPNEIISSCPLMSQGVQTEDSGPGPCSLPHEVLAMRLGDVESQLLRATSGEAERLELLADRMRRALALKNDVIDELKDELWRREREILETRGILSGIGGCRD